MTRSQVALLADVELGQRPETYHDPQQGQTGDTQPDFTEAIRTRDWRGLVILARCRDKGTKAPLGPRVLFSFRAPKVRRGSPA